MVKSNHSTTVQTEHITRYGVRRGIGDIRFPFIDIGYRRIRGGRYMISQMLIDARKYEDEVGRRIALEERPVYHLTAKCGWLNDPNGFSYYNGKYHMFYQYHPYSSQWGPMHWGHAVSEDLLSWDYLPCALAPDMHYDKDGVFSGSAAELPDGRQILVYTGVLREEQPDKSVREWQAQCVAVGDGIDYKKYPKNPVIDANHLPADASTQQFRDPKILPCEGGGLRSGRSESDRR